MFQGQLSKEQALQKLKHYCSYQERSHQEVKEKLYSYKLRKQDVEELLAQLIEDDYLNEERFAIQFAGGKFRMNQWGRVKIVQALKEKRVSQYCIHKALGEIDEAPYLLALNKLASRKWASLQKEKNLYMRSHKTKMYLMQKGYEPSHIQQALQQLKGDNTSEN
ncbi:MAG: regulatory protein RecX [Chitinophagaceae bacterium]